MSILLVAGLGNPGRGYARSRHNLGWVVVDALARKHGLAWRREAAFEAEVARWDVGPGVTRWLMKPQTFMNESGRSVGALARFRKLETAQVASVYDDLTLDVGRLKVTVSGSSGGHNGVASLLEHLGDGFARYRLGIGPKRPPEMDLKDFVLTEFFPEQLVIIEQKLDSFVQGLELLLDRGADQAMNQLNRKETSTS
ncbi:MAG TPA: aminoacyl-tRNA hydrolase [Opitutaceae bacterium]|jgi:PTH1 family peptidyl-tRNA hydrolase